MSLKQRKIKFEPRMKLNHNIYVGIQDGHSYTSFVGAFLKSVSFSYDCNFDVIFKSYFEIFFRSTLHGVTNNQKRWLVFGIALNKVLVTQIRPFVEKEVHKEYSNLQTSHNIHTQSTSGRVKSWPTFLKYENINGNDAYPKLPGGRLDYSKFDCRVTSPVDFAKLYVENHMAKFNAFDEHCDASAVLTLLGKVPVFPPAVQSAAGDIRQARNAWAHCMFSDWDPVNYQRSFKEMENLVKVQGLLPATERDLLGELKDWETKGMCLISTIAFIFKGRKSFSRSC